MAGLASFNKKDWKNAEYYFNKYLSSKKTETEAYALFYSGYSQYKTGQSLSACNTLNQFAKKYPQHPLAWNAFMTASSASLQTSDYAGAANFARRAVAVSSTDEERNSSTLLCAEILSDSGKYDEAVKMLSSGAKENSDFGVLCRYRTARYYARQNRIDESDRMFLEIQNRFSSNQIADESSYSRGELYYNAGDWSKAVSRFNEYQKKFPSGKFKDASFYFMADSYVHLEQNDRAVIQYSNLLKAFPESPYVYRAQKELAFLYKKTGEYEKAYELLTLCKNRFPEESKADLLDKELRELSLLKGGQNPEYIMLSNEYASLGASTSEAGRIKGTELCEFMEKDISMKEDAFILAQELYLIQKKKPAEASYAARTGIIYAGDLRSRNQNEKAAQVYLECAGLTSEAAVVQRALYGAAESFSAADKKGDAEAVVKKLHELYPNSPYDKKASALLK